MLGRESGHIVAVLKKHRRHPSPETSSGLSEAYKAIASLPSAIEPVPVYYKIFLARLQNKAIFNELFCYTLARALGLPVPDDVCLMPCEKIQVVGLSRCLEDRDPDSDWLAGVAFVDLSPRGVTQLIRSSDLVCSELLGWPHLSRAAVFDELILNVGRNRRNVPRTGKGRFALLEHERAFDGPEWELVTLGQKLKKPSNHNDLASLIAGSADEDLKTQMVAVANYFAKSLDITAEFLDIDFSAFDKRCGLQDDTTRHIVELLNRRRKILPKLMFHHLKAGRLIQ